jgi:hypothetical protein
MENLDKLGVRLWGRNDHDGIADSKPAVFAALGDYVLGYPYAEDRLTVLVVWVLEPEAMAGHIFRSQIEVLLVTDTGRRRRWSDFSVFQKLSAV